MSGRSSGWQEKWPSGGGVGSGNGGGGGGGGGGGFRDNSDDEDTSNRRTPEDEFRDEDFDSGFGAKKSAPGFRDTSGSVSSISDTKPSSLAGKPVTGAPRVKKPIDLGAAAAFAAKPPAQQQPSADPYQVSHSQIFLRKLHNMFSNLHNSAQFRETFTAVIGYGCRSIFCHRAIYMLQIRVVSL